MTEYKGYSTFEDVTNDLLQAWNRAETVANICKAKGDSDAESYMALFTDEEQMKVKILLMAASVNGREAVYKKVQEQLDDGE